MINWNQNDTKYIIKRILLYLIIGGIVFCFGSRCAKALTQSEYLYNPGTQGLLTISNGTRGNSFRIQDVSGNNYTAFQNYGEGYVVFTFQTTQGTTATSQIKSVQFGNNTDWYQCELGTTIVYNDASAQKTIYTAKCHVNFSNNKGATHMFFDRSSNSGDLSIWISSLGTFVSDSNGADSIISANNNAIQSQINAIANESANLQSVINQSTQQEIQAINNQTSAINDNTQAIEDLNDTINADLNPTIPTDFLDGLDGLFVTGDSNIIRGILMLPLDIFVIIYNAVTSNTCTTYSFGSLYNVNLSLPCINWQNIVGNGLYIIIDTIMGSALLFGLIRYAKKVLNNAFTVAGRSTDVVEVFK